MSRLHQKQVEKQLIEIVNTRGNDNKCGDCGSQFPTWASYNLGILLCGRCASVHRRVLPANVSKVKSLTLDPWTADQVDRLRQIGNAKARKKWNTKREPFPYDEDDTSEIETYIRQKYVEGRFRDEPVLGFDYDESRYESRYESSRYSEEGRSRRSRLGSVRLRTRSVPRLSHRRLTTFESQQFPRQTSQLSSMGFSDPEAVKEALILSNGDIDFAVDILDEDSKVNPNQEELAPLLPSRPRPLASASNSFQANNPMAAMVAGTSGAGAGAGSSDWWSGASSGVSANQTGQIPQQQLQLQPQIYQYTDPITGRVSYVDSNGQEYLDSSNPEHQQLLYQQQNPQLIAQQTNKQQLMSLYNQPDKFSSNVAVPVDQLKQEPSQPASQAQPQAQPQYQQNTSQPQYHFQQIPQQQMQQQMPQMQQQMQQQQMQPQMQQQTGMQQMPQMQQGFPQGGFQQPFQQQPTGMGFQQPYGQYQQNQWQ